MTQPIRIAMIGCGQAAELGYLPACAANSDVTVPWLVDVDRSRAETLSKTFDMGQVATAHDRVLDAVDAAIIATPPSTHEAIARDCIDAGVDVLTEKPIAATAAAARDLVDRAVDAGVHYAVMRQRRHLPSIRVLYRLLSVGALGPVRRVEVREGREIGWEFQSGFRFQPDRESTGTFADIGPHVLDLLSWLFGPGLEVTEYHDDALGGLEANIETTLVIGDSLECEVEISDTRILENVLRVHHVDGIIEAPLEHSDLGTAAAYVSPADSPTERYRIEPIVGVSAATDWAERMRLQVDRFVDSLRLGDTEYVPASTSIDVVGAIETAYDDRTPTPHRWERTIQPSHAVDELSDSQRILVTGGAGFIGQRVAHRLHRIDGVSVRAFVHASTGPNLARLARLPIEIRQGDARDPEAVEDAMTGCDAVVHCVGGNPAALTEGTRTVATASADAGVNRFVHLSSYVVHGRDPGPAEIDEGAPLDPDSDGYSRAKLEAERIVRELERERELPAVILRPGIVYGPHGIWTRRPIDDIAMGATLVDGGQGVANLVYVDNLLDAIVDSLESDAAVGEAFLLADPGRHTWAEYYDALAQHVDDHPPVRSEPTDRVRSRRRSATLRNSIVPPFRALGTVVDHLRGEATSPELRAKIVHELKQAPWARAMVARMPASWRRRLRPRAAQRGQPAPRSGETSPRPRHRSIPDEELSTLHTASVQLSTAKIERALGWRARVEFSDAIEQIGAWMRYERTP